jgi:hypothetical protein
LIPDVGDESSEGLDQAGHAQRLGAHVRATNARPDVRGCSDYAD